jgi:hypothetical protein
MAHQRGTMKIHPSRTHALKLGLSGPSSPAATKFRDFVDVEKAIVVKKLVDWSGLVSKWQAYLNTQIGDCTCASAGNGKLIATAAVGEPDRVTDADILRMYEHSGFKPGDPETDRGWTLEEAENYMQTIGILGTPENPEPDIVTAASVEPDDEEATQVACELFGGVHLAADMPANAQAQYQKGEAWKYEPGLGSEPRSWGGHALWQVRALLKGYAEYETWGGLQAVGPNWRRAYVVDKRVLVWKDWEAKLPPEVVELGVIDFGKLESLIPVVA